MAGRDFVTYLSGGSSNSNPHASLGGVQSSVEVGSQTAAWDTSSMSGVTLNRGGGNKSGIAGTLTYTDATTSLKWAPPDFTSGSQNEEDVSSDGTFILFAKDDTDPDGFGALDVTVVAASLPVADDTKGVVCTTTAENLFDDVTAAESESGDTEYRCVYVKNNTAASLTLNLWIQLDSSPDDIFVGFDPAGAGGTAQTIANEGAAPSSVTFQQATEAVPLVQALTAGQSIAVWIRRVVPALNTVTNLADTFSIGMKSS